MFRWWHCEAVGCSNVQEATRCLWRPGKPVSHVSLILVYRLISHCPGWSFWHSWNTLVAISLCIFQDGCSIQSGWPARVNGHVSGARYWGGISSRHGQTESRQSQWTPSCRRRGTCTVWTVNMMYSFVTCSLGFPTTSKWFIIHVQSVVRCIWHPKLNQMVVGCGDGKTRLFYDPAKSHRYSYELQ